MRLGSHVSHPCTRKKESNGGGVGSTASPCAVYENDKPCVKSGLAISVCHFLGLVKSPMSNAANVDGGVSTALKVARWPALHPSSPRRSVLACQHHRRVVSAARPHEEDHLAYSAVSNVSWMFESLNPSGVSTAVQR
jgi:hypothetical protein